MRRIDLAKSSSFALPCLLLFLSPMSSQAGARVQSTFDSGNEGWTQMNLDADVRYVLPLDDSPECVLSPPLPGGILYFCDPDAGTWLFDAPAKFLGNQSAMFGGTISWLQHHKGELVGDPPEPGFHLILANATKDIAIVKTLTPPAKDQWVSYSIALDDQSGWAWVDDTTGQEDLPPATASQIREVLESLTAFRIVGEFITGDDLGSLDNVTFSTPYETENPLLTLTGTATNTFIVSWPAWAADWVLENTNKVDAAAAWPRISPPYEVVGDKCSVLVTNSSGVRQFFRLRRP